MANDCRFVFVTGGVMSGIGKGVVSASLGKILQFRGFKISMVNEFFKKSCLVYFLIML